MPVIGGRVRFAKTLAAIDVLSEGRLIVGVGPGSSAADYGAVGVPFDERRRRFEETLSVLRVLLEGDGESFEGEFYSTRGIVLEPRPAQRPRPPIWVASWGSPSGLRLVAHHGDGWIASAYNTTPDLFRAALDGISEERRLAGRTQESFTNAIATAWLYITENRDRAESVLTDILAPMLKRPVEALRALSLPIGPAELSAERLSLFARAEAERICLWPLGATAQLGCFARIAPGSWATRRDAGGAAARDARRAG
jgi:alkanesulfonate monooxygenase SsuD/methylene tetrahydromethanopterin reductase-like flavin-dependent oxidoreductase (luciferase family)